MGARWRKIVIGRILLYSMAANYFESDISIFETNTYTSSMLTSKLLKRIVKIVWSVYYYVYGCHLLYINTLRLELPHSVINTIDSQIKSRDFKRIRRYFIPATLNAQAGREAIATRFKVFDITRPGVEP